MLEFIVGFLIGLPIGVSVGAIYMGLLCTNRMAKVREMKSED